MNTNILFWNKYEGIGYIQKNTDLGLYQANFEGKPQFSFEYDSFNYIETNGGFDVNGQMMPDEHKAEILAYIESVQIPFEWYLGAKNKALFKEYSDAVKSIIGNTDSVEMSSWYKQETEARAYLLDHSAATPTLTILADKRGLGETVEELAAKVIAKAEAYATAYASILGTYQDKQKRVEDAKTVEELAAITWVVAPVGE